MKKLLAFLLLFGAGIGLLLLLQEPAPETPEPRRAVQQQRAPDEPPVTRVQLGGRVQYKQHATTGEPRPMLFELDAADSGQPEGAPPDVWEMLDVVIRLYDPETGEVRAQIDAEAARGVVRSLAGAEPTFELDPIVELQGAVIVARRDAPIVPLTLELPAATVDLEERTIHSNEPSRLSGPGLVARGLGLDVDLEAESYVFPRDGRAAIRFDEEHGAVLGSTAALRVIAGEAGEGGATGRTVVVSAEDGAWLVPTEPGGDDPLDEAIGLGRLDARRIVLTAGRPAGGELTLSQGTAEGDVVYASAAGDFRGERAFLRFDARGLAGARLSGTPRVRLSLGVDPARPGPPSGRPPVRDVRLAGATYLELDLRAGELTLDGPGRMTFGEAQLTARDELFADFPVDENDTTIPRVRARGDVVLDHQGRRLITPELLASREPDERDVTILRAIALGPSRATGQDGDGNPVAITTGERLEVLLGEEVFELPLARQVQIAVGGAEPVAAQADELRDLDPDARRFDAEGHVSFDRGDRHLRGTSLALRGPDAWKLAGEPAVYIAAGVRAQARELERVSREELVAEGDVSARLRGDTGLLLLESEGLSVRREEVGAELMTHVVARQVTDTGFSLREHGERLRADELEAWIRSRPALRGELPPEEAEESGSPAEVWLDVRIVGRGDVAGTARSGTSEYALTCGSFEGFAQRGELGALENGRFAAREGVEVSSGPDPLLHGSGDTWTVDHLGHGRLESTGPQRVHVEGFLPSRRTRFDLEADWIDFSPEHLQAEAVRGRFLQTTEDEREREPVEVHGEAGRLYATRERVSLGGGIDIFGSTPTIPSWALRAGRAEIELLPPDEAAETPAGIGVIEAWENVAFLLGDEGRLSGDHLVARGSTGAVRTTGRPARLERSGLVWESPWVEFDLNLHLPRSGPGTMRSVADAEGNTEPWTLEYRTLETLVQPDRLIQAVQLPVLRTFRGAEPVETRASWAVMWLDRRGWSELSSDDLQRARLELKEDEAAPKQRHVPEYFRALKESALGGVLHELYLEGPIEVVSGGERLMLAEAFYLDAIDGHGWIADMDLSLPRSLGGNESRVILHADWVRHSEDGALRADNALLTACEFEDRHVYIVSRDLRMRPVEGPGPVAYDVELRRNAIHLYGLLVLPLPSIRPLLDEEGEILIDSLRLGSSGRLGSFLEAGFERDLGAVGDKVNKALGGEPDHSRARYKVRASILGSRGVLLDLGLQLRSDKPYWWDFHVGGLNDSNEDRGLVPVPETERDSPRLWYRSRGRYELGRGEWLDFSYHSQTDPGVQAEFWQSSYLRFEERESDLHWRKAKDENYLFAGASVLANDFRTGVERLPEVGFRRAPTPLFHVGSKAVLYSTSATAAALSRKEGDFEGPFSDGFGERDVMRFDNTHRLELPIGLGAVRATPFAELRGTYWDEDVTGTTAPIRGSLVGGLRLATTLWKPLGAAGVQQVTPFVEVRRDAFVERRDGDPVPFDQVERPVEGQFVDVGLRSRWLSSDGDFVDLELRGTHARDVAPGEAAGWQPIGVFGRMREHVGGMPVSLEVDTRYDVEDSLTVFSRTTVGFEPSDAWTFELGHRRGLASDDTALYEAATFGARYRWSPKWEFEAYHALSLQGASSLGSAGIIRRYGHDLVFEIEISRRPGEGGGTISIDLSPLLGWRPSRLGVIDF